jgi:membrane-associated phospholipid phosphatase
MKNNSDEIIMDGNNPSFFPKITQNQPNLDDSKKNNIIASSELKNSLTKPEFNKYTFKSTKMKIISIIIYFIVIIGLELLYRDYLFNKSVSLQEKIHLNPKSDLLLKIGKIISFFAANMAAFIFVFLIFLFMPLNYSFLMLQSIIYSAYFTNTMKMIYQSDRPNWKVNYLLRSCNNGYGNPSGHAFTSVNMYLCLAHILFKYFKIRYVLRILIFIFCILISILIILSRVILAAHSINQIIYGALLGIGVYYILIHIIGYHNYTSIEFYQHIKKKRVKKIYYIFHIFLLFLAVFIYLFTKNKDTSEIEKRVFNGRRCPFQPEYKKFKNDGLFQALSITAMLGAQFGIDILFIILKANDYVIHFSLIEWNKNKKIPFIGLRVVVILFSGIGIIFYFIVPGNVILFFVFVFKSALSFFLGMAGIYSLGIFLCIKLKIANKDIYKKDALHEITAEV